MRTQRGFGRSPAGAAASTGGVATARSNWSASSTVILPCASKSNTRRVSSLMVSSWFLQPVEHIFHSHLAALEPRQKGGHRRRAFVGRRIDLGKGQQRANAVQSVLDGGVADAEKLFHLLDGAVTPHEGGDEDLILGRQLGQRRQLESSLNDQVRADQANAFDVDWGTTGN